MLDQAVTIEQFADSDGETRRQHHRASAQQNWDWLEAHWSDLVPRAYGRFLAVARQVVFLADTLDAAIEWVRTVHPDDTGHIVEYVWPPQGPRIYSGRSC